MGGGRLCSPHYKRWLNFRIFFTLVQKWVPIHNPELWDLFPIFGDLSQSEKLYVPRCLPRLFCDFFHFFQKVVLRSKCVSLSVNFIEKSDLSWETWFQNRKMAHSGSWTGRNLDQISHGFCLWQISAGYNCTQNLTGEWRRNSRWIIYSLKKPVIMMGWSKVI